MTRVETFFHSLFFRKLDDESNNHSGLFPIRMLFIAKSGSGKSWINRNIIYDLRKCIAQLYIFCPTELEQKFYSVFTNRAKIFIDVDEDQYLCRIEEIIQKQCIMVSQTKKRQYKNQLFKFVPVQYVDYIEQYDEQIQYDEKQESETWVEYSQYVYTVNMDKYYDLLYACIELVLDSFKKLMISRQDGSQPDKERHSNKIKLLKHFLQADEETMKIITQTDKKKYSSMTKRLQLMVNMQFQKLNSCCFIVMDDTVADNMFMKEPVMNKLLMQGRHGNISLLVTTQHLNAIPNKLRGNFSFVVISSQDNAKIVKEIREQYLSFLDKKQFDKLLEYCTRDFGCIIVDTINPYRNPIDKIYEYRAENLKSKKFFIGSLRNQLQNMRTKQVNAEVYYGTGEEGQQKKETKMQQYLKKIQEQDDDDEEDKINDDKQGKEEEKHENNRETKQENNKEMKQENGQGKQEKQDNQERKNIQFNIIKQNLQNIIQQPQKSQI